MPKRAPVATYDELIAQIDDAAAHTVFNILVFGPNSSRNICGQYTTITVPCAGLEAPRRGAQFHVAVNAAGDAMPHGENSGMINDFGQHNAASLIVLPTVRTLLDKIYGLGWKIGLDRHSSRNDKCGIDEQNQCKRLRTTVHRDYKPDGTPESKSTWKPGNADFVLPELSCVETPDNHVSFSVLKQSEYHGIPRGGNGFGVYLSAMTAMNHKRYKTQWCARVKAELARFNRTPKIYVWYEFARLDADDFDAMVLACICFGLPPPVFPSGLPYNVPQPYAGSIFPHFKGVTPCAARQTLNPHDELALARPNLSDAAYRALERVAETLPGRWTASPAAVAPAIAALLTL